MKMLLCAITLLFAVSLPAEELSTAMVKSAGRWAGIASFSHSKRGDFYIRRALLTFDVDLQGNVTNGVIRDFAGVAQTAFTGLVDGKGRLNCVTYSDANAYYAKLNLRFGKTTGIGSYVLHYSPTLAFCGTIQCWRETKQAPQEIPSYGSVSVSISHTTVTGPVSYQASFYDTTVRPYTTPAQTNISTTVPENP